jgi:two-component system chemotaxis response regulator CheB
MAQIRVLVVDDSVAARKFLCEIVESIDSLQLAGTASNGGIALAKIPQLHPDVITLDIEMPVMDGLQTLSEIRKLYPRLPVLMCSTLTERGASITLEALALGASDYITKPSSSATLAAAREQIKQELASKILALAFRQQPKFPIPVNARLSPPALPLRIDVLAIGSSTGGPNALLELIPKLPEDFAVPGVVVQHMPPLFTRLLAERLNSCSRLTVHEAEAGIKLEPGYIWVAPGNYHMTTDRIGGDVVLNLNQGPPENSCRPAVDVLLRSVARAFRSHALAVVMTGMGSDGTNGARSIREAGGEIVVQDEATSVVWGMPGSIASLGLAEKICPLQELAPEIIRRVARNKADGRSATRIN